MLQAFKAVEGTRPILMW